MRGDGSVGRSRGRRMFGRAGLVAIAKGILDRSMPPLVLRPFSTCSAASAPCSKATSASPPACTAPGTCSARWCCSIRARPRPAAPPSPSASAALVPTSCCRRRSAASSSARRWRAALGVRAIFAERQDGDAELRRGFSLAPGERVLVVEDVVTTGGSTRETIEVAPRRGRASSAPRRSSTAAAAQQGLDVPFHALATVSLPTYQPDACPLCAAGSPVVKPGSRAEARRTGGSHFGPPRCAR